jgi:hypothetical protein
MKTGAFYTRAPAQVLLQTALQTALAKAGLAVGERTSLVCA